MKTTTLFIITCVYLTSQTLFAADLYRCGNTFQDTPCAGAIKSKVISMPNTNNTSQIAKTVDKDCLQQGESAKKIMWMREVGKTAEDQISTATESATKNLIPQVYKLHGSSIEVKAMIEHECMQQKERDLLATKMMVEVKRLRNGTSNANADKINAQPNQINENINKPLNNNKIARNTEVCNSYQSELDAINAQRKNGGSVIYMEKLKLRRIEIEADIKSTGC